MKISSRGGLSHFSFRPSSFFVFSIFLLCQSPAHAAITVLSYWHLGEKDPQAVSAGFCTNTVDSVGGDTVTFTTSPATGQYPNYTNDVSAVSTGSTHSQLSLTLNGQYGTGNVASGATSNCGLECWVKPGTTVPGGQMLANNGLRGNGFGLFQDGANFEVIFGGKIFLGSVPVTAGAWIHLAVVISNSVTIFYTNGVAAATFANTPLPPSGAFTIGGDSLYGELFTGAIDEVRLFTFNPASFTTNDLLLNQIPGTYSFNTTNLTLDASAWNTNVTLTVTPLNATWTVSANVPWIHPAVGSGSGNATIAFTVDANIAGGNPTLPRVGQLAVGDQLITITQGQPSYSIAGNFSGDYGAPTMEVSNTASSNSVPLTVSPNGASWSLSTGASWVHLLNPSGTGSTNLMFTVDPNTDPGGAVRQAQILLFNPSFSFVTRLVVFQAAPNSGLGQKTYRFTGNLQPFAPQFIPANASAALKSVASNDVFFLTMTLVDNPPPIYFDVNACAAARITFSVPSRGLVYSAPWEDFEVIHDANNPDTLRWDVPGVDSTVTMIFWARDFNQTALSASGSAVPDPLNLTGFHANGFAQVILFDAEGPQPELFYGNLIPMPILNIQAQPQHTNAVSWLTSDATFGPTLQTSTSLVAHATWQTISNIPPSLSVTNIIMVPATNKAQFYRLQVN